MAIYPNNQQRQDEVLRQHTLLERLDTLDETIAVARGASAGALAAVAAGAAEQRATHEQIMARSQAYLPAANARDTALLTILASSERAREGIVEIQTILDREKRLREEERRTAPDPFPIGGIPPYPRYYSTPCSLAGSCVPCLRAIIRCIEQFFLSIWAAIVRLGQCIFPCCFRSTDPVAAEATPLQA